MRKLYFILIIFFSISSNLFSQEVLSCGMSPATAEERRFIAQEIATIALDRNDEMHCIPVQPYIFTKNDNTGGLTEIELNTGLSYLNYHFRNAGIQFYWAGTPVYVHNTDIFDFNKSATDLNGADTENELVTLAGHSTTAVNLYFINSITQSNGNPVEGYAYYPGNSPVSNRIFITNGAVTGASNGTMVHEFGHYFGLLHTHEGTEEGPASTHAENVARSGSTANCFTEGDMICDTESDPKFSVSNFDYAACTYEGNTTDQYGLTYNPMIGNIMSYYPDNCGGYFTSGQTERIQQGLEARLAATFYSLESYSGVQQAPSILNATYDPTLRNVKLTWTNAAGNNTGFLLERSSDQEQDFTTIPGSVTNFYATEFIDTQIEDGISYSYRLKPTNGSCYVYSGIASINIASEICTPITTEEIGNTYIDMFRLKENTQILLLKNSAYQYTGYSDYTAETVDVKAGASLQFVARAHKINDNFTPQNISIWLDINGDRDFDDAGERLFLSTGTPVSELVAGNILLPINLSAGFHRLRVRSRSAPDSPSNACADYTSGETEDYMLDIESNTITGTSNPEQVNTNQIEINTIEPAEKPQFNIYPNPVINSTNIEFTATFDQAGIISVTDLNGIVLLSKEYDLIEGINTLSFDMNNLSEGMYIITMGSAFNITSKTVFKKNDD